MPAESRYKSLLWITILGSLATGCQSLPVFTPEQAEVKAFLEEMPLGTDFQVDMESIRVLQTLPWRGGFMVLVGFDGFQNGPRNTCLVPYHMYKEKLSWVSN